MEGVGEDVWEEVEDEVEPVGLRVTDKMGLAGNMRLTQGVGGAVGMPGRGVGLGVGLRVGSLLQKHDIPQISPTAGLQRLGTAGHLWVQGTLNEPLSWTPGGRPGSGIPPMGFLGVPTAQIGTVVPPLKVSSDPTMGPIFFFFLDVGRWVWRRLRLRGA